MWNVVDFVTNSLYVATVALRLVAWHKVSKCQKYFIFLFDFCIGKIWIILKHCMKYKRFKKIARIQSYHLQWKFKWLAGKFTWGVKGKHCWVMSTNFLFLKVCWQRPAMFCFAPQANLPAPIIWIFTEGDGIKSRLSS